MRIFYEGLGIIALVLAVVLALLVLVLLRRR